MRKNKVGLTPHSKPAFKISFWIGTLILSSFFSQAQNIVPQLWVTNGRVSAIATSGNTIYIGGSFTHVGPNVAYGAAIHKNSNAPDLRYVMPDGGIDVSVPDGHGGWYIGGTFSSVGGEERKLIARINADGSLHPWNPGANGFYVSSMIIANGRLYVAGSFEVIAGERRSLLASFDLATGQLTSWHPENDGLYINSMALKGNTLYVNGGFWELGGAPRNNIGAVDITTGLATSWNPDLSGDLVYIRSMAIAGNSVIVGGEIYSLAGEPRMNLGAIDANTGQVTNWNPCVVGNVFTLTVDDHTLYVGGQFTSVDNHSRYNLASFNLNNMKLNSWKPRVNNSVNTIVLREGKLFIGGDFTSVNGIERNRIAAFYSGSGKLASWQVPVNGSVTSISFSNRHTYIGGYFSSIGGETRKNIAALDAHTGRLLSWDPGANADVTGLKVINKKLFVGGSFDSIDGKARDRLASFDLRTGRLSSWNPVVTGGPQGDNGPGHVNKMFLHGNTLYFMGYFTKVNGQVRKNLAAVDAGTGALSTFYPFTQETTISDITLANGKLYIAGPFNQMSGQPRSGLASFDLATGQLTPWSPAVQMGGFSNALADAITSWGNTVYVGGSFEEINGEPRRGLAAVDGNTGVLKNWNHNAPLFSYMNIFSLVTDGSKVYLGTTSTTDALMIFDAHTGEHQTDHPLIMNTHGTADDGDIYVIHPSGNRLYIGGDITSVDRQPRPFFAGFDMQRNKPKLVFFKSEAERHGGQTKVYNKWSTKYDQSLSHFLVERSADNIDFTSIGRIDASQNLQPIHFYDFKDRDPLPATSYYRLRMVGKDNSEWLSSTNRISINNGCHVNIYPSPADKEATVDIKRFPGNTVNIVLHDHSGQPVWARSNLELTNGCGIVRIPVARLTNGHYVLHISSGNIIESRSIFVQH